MGFRTHRFFVIKAGITLIIFLITPILFKIGVIV